MDTLELLNQQRDSLVKSLESLRATEAAHLRMDGLRVEEEKLRSKKVESEGSLAEAKARYESAFSEKTALVLEIADRLAERMRKVLPVGTAMFNVTDEGEVLLGWNMNGVTVPVQGLSGGQTVMFLNALAYALLGEDCPNRVLLMEAAEVGPQFEDFMGHIMRENPDAQLVAATCFPVKPMESGAWRVVALDGAPC